MPDLISSGVALFFAWLFALAGVHKLRSPAYYVDLLASYFPSLPASPAWLVAPVAALELAIAALLIFPQTLGLGLLGCAAVLCIYAIAMALQIWRGKSDMACGCAGPASNLSVSPALVIRNLLCATLALCSFALLIQAQTASVEAGLVGYGLSAFVAGFMIVLYLCSDQLIANAQQMAGEQ
jgi:Methylamine utilisation protein MauE